MSGVEIRHRMKESGKAFDFKLFRRLLAFTNAYRLIFYFVAFAAVAMSCLAILRPYLLKRAIDESILPKDSETFLYFLILMLVVLFLEVLFQFAFIFYANCWGKMLLLI